MSIDSMSRRSFLAAGAAASALAVAGLSGCGGSGSASSSASASASASGSAGSAKGGTITAGLSHSTTKFSPVGASSALGLPADQHVFEGLYMIDFTDYSTYAALAAGDPEKVGDLQYEIKLREGAKFSNGNAVTAADVVNAFEANMAEGKLYVPFLSFIDTITAKDDTTVALTLKYEFAGMKSRLANVLVFPKDDSSEKMDTDPVGSGPWMFDKIDGNDGGKITFKPNPEYNGPKPAKADAMEWNVLMDATSRTTAMTEGSIMAMEDVPDANADAVVASGATLDYLDGFCLPFLMFNCIKAPFDDPRVRQAFFYAIDIDKLIANQLNGHAKAPSCFLPESHKNYNKASNVFTYDPEKAKALLEEAGVSDLSINFRVNGNWVKDLGPQIQNDFQAIGVNVELDVNPKPYDDMKEASIENPYAWDIFLAPGDPSCFGNDPDLLMSWWYDNDQWLQTRTCWGLATDGKSAELREMLAAARQETDEAKQQELWNQCFDFISEQVPLYPILHKQMPTAYNEKLIAGFEPISATGLFFMDASVK